MKKDRAIELLNAVIDHISVAENTSNTLAKLLAIGFTEDELVNEFDFSREDVEAAVKESENND